MMLRPALRSNSLVRDALRSTTTPFVYLSYAELVVWLLLKSSHPK
jgi:hypothetical protein